MNAWTFPISVSNRTVEIDRPRSPTRASVKPVSATPAVRRGATDLRKLLLMGASRVEAANLPKPGDRETEEAYEVAHKLWISLDSRVTNASLAAFASDHSELGESMHRMATAADTLQRGLERYSTRTPSHGGEYRTPKSIAQDWRLYVGRLLQVEEQGRKLGFTSPIRSEVRGELRTESRLDEASGTGAAPRSPDNTSAGDNERGDPRAEFDG